MALIDLFIDRKKLAKANATYKARMATIKEKEELDALSLEAARLANKESFKSAMRENNRVFKEKMAALKEQ